MRGGASWSRAIALALALACSASAPLASAQEPAAEGEAEGDSAAQDEAARQAFMDGRARYSRGDFEGALESFEEAYRLSGRPELLYNIAQAAERTRDDRRALEAYQGYLDQVETSDQREFVLSRVLFLERRLRAEEAEQREASEAAASEEQAASPVSEPSDETDSSGSNAAPIALLAGGGAAAAAGAVLVGMAARGRNGVEEARDGASYADVSGAGNRASGLGYAGQILLGVGVAAAATGVVLMLVSGDDEGDEGATVQLRVGPTSVAVQGSF